MMRGSIFLVLITLIVSCSNKYQPYQSRYNFKSGDGKPEYSDLDYWAAHPWKWDPSDSISAALSSEKRDTLADVFFMHPTTFTKKKYRKHPNARIDDEMLNAKTDYSTILYQASAFNQHARVFAPRYRQAHIYNFFSRNKEKAAAAFDLAYQDLRSAFIFYLQNWNKGRPIIIASHSQGSFLGERLLKEFFDPVPVPNHPSLSNQLVAAYIIGWPVPAGYFSTLKICSDSLQTGCLCSWRTFRKNYIPYYIKKENGSALVTNPLNWTTNPGYIGSTYNKGSILTNYNRLYKNSNGAQISNGVLFINKPKFPGSFLYWSRNYHIGDINLFYINLRNNIETRINRFYSINTKAAQ